MAELRVPAMSDLATWKGFEGPPATIMPSPRWVRVKAGDTLIADSRRAQLLAWYGPGRLPTYCLPAEDVRTDLVGRRRLDLWLQRAVLQAF